MFVLFIDSGIGGLTTLATTINLLPNLNFIYYADDKFSPYGNLEPSQIFDRLVHIISSFRSWNIGMVVLACNTATAAAIDKLRAFFSMPIIGTEPAIKLASGPNNNLLLLATPATSKNSRLGKLIINCPCNIEISPMPTLAKQIDNYFLLGDTLAKEEIDETIKYIASLSTNKTHIVLGCTHYVHLREAISRATKKEVVDGNLGVAKQIIKKLDPSFLSSRPIRKFIVSSQNRGLIKKYIKIFNQTLAKECKLC